MDSFSHQTEWYPKNKYQEFDDPQQKHYLPMYAVAFG